MSNTRTHPTDDVLADFVLGKLSDSEGAEVEEHLAECPECQHRAAAAQPADTLVELLASAVTKRDSEAAAPTPTLANAATPSLFAATQVWDAAAPQSSAEVPAALAEHPKYRVVRRLGEGGMGTVWLAEHTVMNRLRAVKVIRPDLLAKPGAAARFLREVRAAAKLHHPNIVTAFDAEPVGNSVLFVMEFVEGETLAERLKAGPLSVSEACRAARDAARGLAHAHSAGLVHRDVKPHNLIRATDGTVKVLDFGLAGVASGETIVSAGDGLTGAGMVCGTPDYIAPEQIADPHAADARSDIYGLGCTLYHLLAGRAPFRGATVVEKLAAQEKKMPEPIPHLAPELAAILAKMLAKRSEDRYQTADEVVAALEAVLDRAKSSGGRAERIAPRRRWVAVAAGLFFAALIVAAGVVFKIQRDNEEITITTDDPDIEVVMKRKGELVRIRDTKTKQEWELNTLTNEIGLVDQPGGLTIKLPEREPFTLKRNGKDAFTVIRVPRADESDRQRILGVWVAVAAELDGQPAPRELLDVLRPTLTFTPEKVTARPGGAIPKDLLAAAAKRGLLSKDLALLEKGLEGVYHLDPAKSPKTIDITILGDDLRRSGLGIYSLEGDTLKLCLSLNPEKVSERPTEFSSKGGGLRGIVTFKRQSPEKVGEVHRFEGHTEAIHSLALSRDGRYVVASTGGHYLINRHWRTGADFSPRLWDLASGREVREFKGHTNSTDGVAFSRDDRYILSGSCDFTMRLWDAQTGKEVRKFEGHTGWVRGVAFSPDGAYALSAGRDLTLRLWDVETGKEVRQFVGHEGYVEWVAFSHDGRQAISSSTDKTVRLWDVETGKEIRSFLGHTEEVRVAAFSPDSRRAVSGGDDNTVRLWDVATGKELYCFKGHTDFVCAVAFSPDGRRILSGSFDNTMRLWDAESGTELYCFKGHTLPVSGVVFKPDGNHAISSSYDHTLRLWRLPDPEPEKFGEVRRFEGHKPWATRAVFSLDGGRIISSGDATRMWNVFTGKQSAKYDIEGGGWALVLSPDGKQLLCSGADVVHLLDLDTGREVHQLKGHTKGVWGAAFLPGGKRAITGGPDATLREWDLEKGEEIRQFEGVKEGIRCLSLSPDGTKLAVGHFINGDTGGSNLRVWDTKTGKEVRAAIPLAHVIVAVAFAQDGKRVVTGDLDGRVRLWDIETGEELVRFEKQTGPVEGVAFTPDGRIVSAGGTGDGSLRIWDPKTGKQLHAFAGPTEGLLGLAISSDGRFATTGAKDAIIRLWRLPDPPPPERVCEVRRFDGDEKDGVWSVDFSRDGKRVLKGGGTHVILYDRATGENVLDIRHGCWSAVLSPNGNQILTATHDGTVHLWDSKTGEQQKLNVPQLGRCRNAVFAPNGKMFASSHADGFVHVWNSATGEEVQKFPAYHHAVRSAAFRPGTDQILVVRGNNSESDKTLCLYDVKTGNEVRTFEGHTDMIFDVAVSEDGRRALSGGDKTVRLWNLDTGKQVLCLEGHTDAVAAVAFCPGGRRAVSAGRDKTVRLWNLETGKEICSFEGHTGHVVSVAVSSDGRFAVSGSCDDKTVRLWRLPDPTAPVARTFAPAPEKPGVVQKLRLGAPVLFAQVAPNGRTFITGDGSGGVDLRETATGKVVQTLPGWTGVYADDGKKIVTARQKGEDFLSVYDVATGQRERTFGKPAGQIRLLASIAGGDRVLTVDSEQNFQLFDITRGTELATWKGGNSYCTFTPDGRRVFTRAPGETRYSVRDTATGKPVDEFDKIRGVLGLFTFSADGLTVRVLPDVKTPATIYRVSDGTSVGRPGDFPDGGSPELALILNLSPDRTKVMFLHSNGVVHLCDSVTFKVLNSVRVDLPCKYTNFVCPIDLNQGATPDGRFAILRTNDADGHVIVVRFPDPPAAKP